MIKLALIAGLVAALAAGAGGYALGHQHGVESQAKVIAGWIEQTAALEVQVHQLKADGDARAKRAEAAASKATAELARVRKEAEADRAKWVAEASDGWNHYLDAQRVPVAAGADTGAALAACRADEAASRRAIGHVIAAALDIRTAAVVNTEQLRQLQRWVEEVTR